MSYIRDHNPNTPPFVTVGEPSSGRSAIVAMVAQKNHYWIL